MRKTIRRFLVILAAAAMTALSPAASLIPAGVTAFAGNGVAYVTYTVQVESGYLALRNAKAYDRNNEIGRLWTGDTVEVMDTSDSQYWYVYAPTLGKYGYVNKDYLRSNVSGPTYKVRVESGYLALRNAMAYDSSNEIGRLWTGDTVQVLDTSGYQYWYVYAPSLGKYGYVNKDYIYSTSSSSSASS